MSPLVKTFWGVKKSGAIFHHQTCGNKDLGELVGCSYVAREGYSRGEEMKSKLRIFALVVLLVVFGTISVAMAEEAPEVERAKVEWAKTFGGRYSDGGCSVAQTIDGG